MVSAPVSLSVSSVHAVAAVTALSATFAVKHFAADFLMQTEGMARGKERVAGWALPLLAHVLCHCALTLLILLVVSPGLWWLAAAEGVVHLAVDRGKTILTRRGGWRPDQPQFWWLLGLDQCLHQLTNVALAAAIVLL